MLHFKAKVKNIGIVFLIVFTLLFIFNKEIYFIINAKCTKDCSGTRAGFNWVELKQIESVGNCTGKSQSFINGCQLYVRYKY